MNNYEQEFNQFQNDTIKELLNELKQYSLKIDGGNALTQDYADYFLTCKELYNFTKDDKKHTYISKQTVDNAAQKLLVMVRQDIAQGNDTTKAAAYCYLAAILEYKKDNKKALEAYNKAVMFDKSYLIHRATFKNIVLNDKKGALEDYNAALANETNKDRAEFIIKHCIANIDSHRDMKRIWFQFILTAIIAFAVIAYSVFQIYVIFVN